MVVSLLTDVDVILGFAILILTIFYGFQFPPVLGFLTGILIGPYGLGLINGGHIVDLSSELGILFLLFTIGVDLSLNELRKMKKDFLLGGILHFICTTIIFFILFSAMGFSPAASFFICLLVTHSSTAVVLKVFQDKMRFFLPMEKSRLQF